MFVGIGQHLRRFVLCALGPLVIVLTGRWLFNTIINCKAIAFAQNKSFDFETTIPPQFVAAQYAWGMSLVVLAVAFMVAAAWLASSIVDELGEHRSAAGAILVAIGGVTIVLTTRVLMAKPSFDNCVSENLLEPVLKTIVNKDGTTSFLAMVQYIAATMNVGAITVTLLLVAATSVITRPIQSNGDDAVRELAWRIDKVKKLLYVGAIVLVAGIMSFVAVYDLPTGLLGEDKTLIAGAKELARGPLIFWGVTLTLILIANYAPATYFLNREALRLARELGDKSTPKDTDAWIQEQNLALSMREQSKRILTMASPLLAAFLPAVMQAFVKSV